MPQKPLLEVFITLLLAVPQTSCLAHDLFEGHKREEELTQFISDMCGKGPIEEIKNYCNFKIEGSRRHNRSFIRIRGAEGTRCTAQVSGCCLLTLYFCLMS